MMIIVMVYDKSRDGDDNYAHDHDNNSRDDDNNSSRDDDDDDNSDTRGMNDIIIFRSTNIYYNQHHGISYLFH